ncbi:MAG: murein L,D-transpeptidase YafK [Woeseiaceae bacterium]|jgi:murein L,D-transpeptidase YafK
MILSIKKLLFILLVLTIKLGYITNLNAEELYPAYLIEIPSSIENVFIADIENAKLIQYSVEKNRPIKNQEYYMSVGKNGSGKKIQGDKKTPLGVYFITEKLDISKLPPRYGAAAYPLDYPNSLDRYMKKTGYGIWLHGTDPDILKRPPRDTDGCLALQNKQLLELSEYLVPMNTPIIVVKTINWKTEDQLNLIRNELHEVLGAWKLSFESSESERFVSFYDTNVLMSSISEYSIIEDSSVIKKSIVIMDLTIIGDPLKSDIVLTRFTQKIRYNDIISAEKKRLYWQKQKDGWKIIATDLI